MKFYIIYALSQYKSLKSGGKGTIRAMESEIMFI